MYRPNVAAILQNADGDILICERLDYPGSWQFPQGGINAGESAGSALPRELREELSLEPAHYRIEESRGPYRYLFPEGSKKKRYCGQEQTYFRLHLLGPADMIDTATAHPEFRAVRWIKPAQFLLSRLPAMKREVYRRVLWDFFRVKLS